MTNSLFRTEVLDARFSGDFGDEQLVPRVSHLFASALAMTVVCGIAGILLFGRYAPSDTVRGYALPPAGTVRVFAQSEGVITDVYVAEGDAVVKGQVLLSLATARSSGLDQATTDTILSLLKSEKTALQSQSSKDSGVHELELARLDREIDSLTKRLPLATRQVGIAEDAVRIAEEELRRLTGTDVAPFVPATSVSQARDALLSRQQRFNIAVGELQKIESDIVSAKAARNVIAAEYESRALTMTIQQARLARQIAEAEAHSSQTIAASSDGRISALTVVPGQRVDDHLPLMTIIPDAPVDELELLVTGPAAANLRRGARLRIRCDDFPYQRFGVLRGRITHIARSKLLPGDRPGPLPASEAYYLARATVDDPFFHLAGKRFDLQAGMAVTVDVLREKRRLIEWLFEPLVGATRRF